MRQTFAVTPGATVRITAYGRVFASTPDYPNPSDANVQSRMRIGAEPNGSIEWYSGTVVWSGMANPHGTWAPFTLDVTAGASGTTNRGGTSAGPCGGSVCAANQVCCGPTECGFGKTG